MGKDSAMSELEKQQKLEAAKAKKEEKELTKQKAKAEKEAKKQEIKKKIYCFQIFLKTTNYF